MRDQRIQQRHDVAENIQNNMIRGHASHGHDEHRRRPVHRGRFGRFDGMSDSILRDLPGSVPTAGLFSPPSLRGPSGFVAGYA
jgi:hypothetical protein